MLDEALQMGTSAAAMKAPTQVVVSDPAWLEDEVSTPATTVCSQISSAAKVGLIGPVVMCVCVWDKGGGREGYRCNSMGTYAGLIWFAGTTPIGKGEQAGMSSTSKLSRAKELQRGLKGSRGA